MSLTHDDLAGYSAFLADPQPRERWVTVHGPSRACWRRPTSGPEIMDKVQYPIGDMVFAAEDIFNDGGMPGIEEEEGLIVAAGLRGVVVHSGVAEMDESKEIYLVQFENGPDAHQPVLLLREPHAHGHAFARDLPPSTRVARASA